MNFMGWITLWAMLEITAAAFEEKDLDAYTEAKVDVVDDLSEECREALFGLHCYFIIFMRQRQVTCSPNKGVNSLVSLSVCHAKSITYLRSRNGSLESLKGIEGLSGLKTL